MEHDGTEVCRIYQAATLQQAIDDMRTSLGPDAITINVEENHAL